MWAGTILSDVKDIQSEPDLLPLIFALGTVLLMAQAEWLSLTTQGINGCSITSYFCLQKNAAELMGVSLVEPVLFCATWNLLFST